MRTTYDLELPASVKVEWSYLIEGHIGDEDEDMFWAVLPDGMNADLGYYGRGEDGAYSARIYSKDYNDILVHVDSKSLREAAQSMERLILERLAAMGGSAE